MLAKPANDADANGCSACSPADARRADRRRAGPGWAESSAVVDTRVRFRPLTAEEIDWYVASGEPRDKAGAYGCKGWRPGSSIRWRGPTATSSACRSGGQALLDARASRRAARLARASGPDPGRLTGPAAEGILFQGRTSVTSAYETESRQGRNHEPRPGPRPGRAALFHAQRGTEFYKHVDEVMVNPRPGRARTCNCTASW